MKGQIVALLLLLALVGTNQPVAGQKSSAADNDCAGIASRLEELKNPKKRNRRDTAALKMLLAGTSAEKQAGQIMLGIDLEICKLDQIQPPPANYNAKKTALRKTGM